MTLLWLFSGAALALAVAALVRARTSARRLDRLVESYWQLQYEHGQLKARLARLEGERAGDEIDRPDPAKPGTSFVPLSSLKR